MVKRAEKVAEAIHEIVSGILVRGMKDPRIGFVTITGVKVTDDLHLATLYYTVVGTDEEKRDTARALDHARGFFRTSIGRELRMKYVPDIVFRYDSSIEYGNRIETILRDIAREEHHDDQSDP